MLVRSVPFVLLALALVAPSAAPAAPADPRPAAPLWAAIGTAPEPGKRVQTRPARFRAYELDRGALAAELAGTPPERSRRPGRVVRIAGPGGVQRFRVVESPIMEPALAARHPEIRTYAGRGIDDRSASVRFDVSPLGFHASVRSRRGHWYVDPYYRGDDGTYVAYYARDISNVHGPRMETPPAGVEEPAASAPPAAKAAGEPVTQRIYRLALVSDPSYATYFGAENVTAAKVTLMNRVNQLYNDDLAIKMILIAENDKLNLDTEAEYRDPGGSCVAPCYPPGTGEACDSQTITHNNVAIDAAVGPTSYDIGHIVLGMAGGGVAGLGVVGDPAEKATGCTGVPTPVGDYFAVDYVAHEMGHQFAGNHTFNGNQHNCSGNRRAAAAVEPGSGSTVMSYAGICRQDNLQAHSDPYFSQRSIDEIEAYITSENEEPGSTHQGFETVVTGNRSPVVTAPAVRTIPVRTPFTLTGSATDPDGDDLVYLWEQNDQGVGSGVALVNNTKPNGPLFRVFGRYGDIGPEATLLSPSPGQNVATVDGAVRTFPDPAQIAAGNTNAASGTCPAVTIAPPSPEPAPPPLAVPVLECYSEFLPTSARTLRFRLTARDLAQTGGGLSHAETLVNVAGTEPFLVTSQGSDAAVDGLAPVPVTWNVAGTDAAPFDVANVRITFSTDGGLTFPVVVAESTPNDGVESVAVPNVATSLGRFRVEAVDNYFFDVSRGNLTVTPVAEPEPEPEPAPSATAEPAATPAAEPAPAPIPSDGARRGAEPIPTVLLADLARTSRRLRVVNGRRVRVRVRCLGTGPVAGANRCAGVVRLLASGRRIAARRFSVPRDGVSTVVLTLGARDLRRLRRASLLVTVRTTAGPSTKKSRILRLRR